MTLASLWPDFRTRLRHESSRPDLARALRALFSVAVPLVAGALGWMPWNLTFVVFAAQNIAMVDVRGAYTFRLGLLIAMTAILASASALGGFATSSIVSALIATALIAACGGIWRHFAPDYGPSLAIASTILFLVSVSSPPEAHLAADHGWAALVGGLWGVFLQTANWPIRSQHPLRRAVSDSWAAVATLFEALAPPMSPQRATRIVECENALRVTLDQTYAALASPRHTPLRQRLEDLNLAAARVATRVVALNTALESLLSTPEGVAFAASLQPVLKALTNISRSIAVAVVSRQPGHLATCEVRAQRLAILLRAVVDEAPPPFIESHGGAQLRSILHQIEQNLPHALDLLRATIDRAEERAAFSLELFDLDTWTLRPLASAVVLHRPVDRALIRFTARVMVLTVAGVAIFKYGNLPHGYWLPLTVAIVLQPDYGSTRQRAAQRVLGTLAGSVAASLLLWFHLPPAALIAATTVTVFGFALFLKRRYAVAVFFITLAVVLLTEAHGPVTLAFTIERLATTLAGGALALLAALFFWPVWERDRLPPILAAALVANRDYARLIADRLGQGGAYDPTVIAAKRVAETANSTVFASLQRMMGDPRHRRDGLEKIAAYANGNQRITRALTVLALQLAPKSPPASSLVASGFAQISQALDSLAKHLLDPAATQVTASTGSTSPSSPPFGLEAQTPRDQGMLEHLARIRTELAALRLWTGPDSPELAAATPTSR